MKDVRFQKSDSKIMDRATSIYLDLVRLLMAITVLIHHLGETRVGGDWAHFPRFGPDAVIVFFVLSGFVITYAAERESVAQGYFASRLARLWSVLAPALIITFILDLIGRHIDASVYDSPLMGWNEPGLRCLIALSFTNELWFTSTTPFSNIPVWSLGFEFWYYAIFGLWFYGFRRLSIVAAVMAGPKILLLAPIWLIGVVLYKRSPHRLIPASIGACLCLGPLLLYLPLHSMFSEPLRQLGNQLLDLHRDSFADAFLWDYVLTVLMAAHFVGFFTVKDKVAPLLFRAQGPIRKLSDFTLSIYLFHFPILLLMSAATHAIPIGAVRSALILSITLLACLGLGRLIEPRRKALKKFILGLMAPGAPGRL